MADDTPTPRVLWRGVITLRDGLQLRGASIVTTMQPWTHLRGEYATEASALEAEAELCFALEMVRHHPLRVKHADPNTSLGDGALLEASGSIELRLDGADDATVAYMQQLFCIPGTQPVLTLVYDPSARASGGVFELVVFGRERTDGALDLVVGRYVRKTKAARPDDPLPRVPEPTPLDVRIRKRGQLVVHPEQRAASIAPGRRGEARARSKSSPPPSPKPSSAAASWHPVIPIFDAHTHGTAGNASVEESNRTMIKKLIKYQLAGRGIEREHNDHAACFQTAYAGTCLVFRDALASSILDKERVAPIVQAHLDMYVTPRHLALCVRR